MYDGLALQNRIKEKILPLNCSFCIFSFQWTVSNICVVLSVQQQGSMEAGTNTSTFTCRAAPSQASGFQCFYFLLLRIVCVLGWGVVTGDKWCLRISSLVVVSSVSTSAWLDTLQLYLENLSRFFVCLFTYFKVITDWKEVLLIIPGG